MLPVIVRRCIHRFFRLVPCPYLVSRLQRQLVGPGFSRRGGVKKIKEIIDLQRAPYLLDPPMRGDTCTSL